ncbi:hypothetical protein F2P56_004039, partial [Juglans regia]
KQALPLNEIRAPTEINPPTERCPQWCPPTKRCPQTKTEKQALKEEGIGCGTVSIGVPKLSLDLKIDVKGKRVSASLSLWVIFLSGTRSGLTFFNEVGVLSKDGGHL